MQDQNMERLYTLSELQNLLGIGRNTAYGLVKSGIIVAFKTCSHWRVPESSVKQYLDRMRGDQAATPEKNEPLNQN